MKTILTYLVLCMALFAAGAGLAWALGVPPKLESLAAAMPTPVPPAIEDAVPSDPNALVQSDNGGPPPVELPVPIRGESLTAEELFRFGAMYREQQQAITARDKALRRREARLKLVHDDVNGTRQELDGMRAQVRDMMTQAERLLRQIESEHQRLAEEQAKTASVDSPKQNSAEMDAAEATNLRTVSTWFQNMPPEKAAEHLKQLSNEGRLDSAVQMLANIEERNVAKILSQMDDASLVVEITEAFRKRKQPELQK